MHKNIRLAVLCTCSALLWACTGDSEPQSAAIPSSPTDLSIAATPEPQRPNFLLITSDDMGYTDLGAFGGHDIPTPNLDALAMEGVRLTNFHANVSCAPTRSMLMSGTGNHEAGMGSQHVLPEFVGNVGYEGHLSNRVASLPERMHAGGYHTYMAGKWHLGDEEGATLPNDRGFERSFALLPGGWDHFRVAPDAERPDVGEVPAEGAYTEDGRLVGDLPEDFYSTTAYIDKMIGYIDSNRDSDQPFFAWLAPTAPHWPLQVLPEWKDRFAGQFDQGYEALCHARQQAAFEAGVLPDGTEPGVCPEIAKPWADLTEDERILNRRVMELYAAMVAHLDSEIGRLLNYLDDIGELENTYIIYHNDNGPQGGAIFDQRSNLARFDNSLENLGNPTSWVNVGQGWADAQSAPYREEKGSPFEGGIRVPAFIRPPQPVDNGRISNSLLTVMDVMPTIMELAGIQESNYPQQGLLPIRGKSFAALLNNTEQRVHAEDEAIALDHAGLSFMREGDWKILRKVGSDEWQLFNTGQDPRELNNLAASNPGKLADMVAKYDAHAQATGILRR